MITYGDRTELNVFKVYLETETIKVDIYGCNGNLQLRGHIPLILENETKPIIWNVRRSLKAAGLNIKGLFKIG